MNDETQRFPRDMPKRPFPLGRIFVAGEVLNVAGASEIIAALHRHQTGDWGECTPSDWKWNDEALAEENTIYSACRSKTGFRFTIVTSEDRTLTTSAAPELYYALGESCWFTLRPSSRVFGRTLRSSLRSRPRRDRSLSQGYCSHDSTRARRRHC